MHTHAYTCIHLHTFAYICIHLHTFAYICIHLHTFAYIHTYIHTFAYIHEHPPWLLWFRVSPLTTIIPLSVMPINIARWLNCIIPVSIIYQFYQLICQVKVVVPTAGSNGGARRLLVSGPPRRLAWRVRCQLQLLRAWPRMLPLFGRVRRNFKGKVCWQMLAAG